MVITLPVSMVRMMRSAIKPDLFLHLVVEDLGLASLGLRNQTLIKHVEDVLADFLEFGFDLLAIVADGCDMLVRALGFLLLLDGGDYAPGGTSGSDHILVGDRQQVPLIDSKLTANLCFTLALPEVVRSFVTKRTSATPFM